MSSVSRVTGVRVNCQLWNFVMHFVKSHDIKLSLQTSCFLSSFSFWTGQGRYCEEDWVSQRRAQGVVSTIKRKLTPGREWCRSGTLPLIGHLRTTHSPQNSQVTSELPHSPQNSQLTSELPTYLRTHSSPQNYPLTSELTAHLRTTHSPQNSQLTSELSTHLRTHSTSELPTPPCVPTVNMRGR